MAIQSLSDLPNIYKSEWAKFDELVKTYPLTTTGAYSYTSPSSGVTYSTTTGGSFAVFTQLQSVLSPYLLTSAYWNSIQTEITNNIATLKTVYTTAGTSPTYTVTVPASAGFTLTSGQSLKIKFHATSAVASTLNVNSLGAKAIKKANGNDFTNIYASVYTLLYDGTNFILQGEGASGNAVASDLLLGKTATTDVGEIVGTIQSYTLGYNPSSIGLSGNYLKAYIPNNGFWTTAAYLQILDNNWIEANLKKDVNVFGKIGTCKELQQSNGALVTGLSTSWSATSGTYYSSTFNITGLSFTPSQIFGGAYGNIGTQPIGGTFAYGTYLTTSNTQQSLVTISFDSVVFGVGTVSGRVKAVVTSATAGSFVTNINFVLA